jgi:hypothetical protein
MNWTNFRLKPIGSLTAEDFQQSPLWAGYYEPDDVDEMVRWGIPETAVRDALDGVQWEDDHYFPLPLDAANSKWMRGKLFGITATTTNGLRLSGYAGETHDYLVVFFYGEAFVLSSHTPDGVDTLSAATGSGSVFPLVIDDHVTGETWVYPPSA